MQEAEVSTEQLGRPRRGGSLAAGRVAEGVSGWAVGGAMSRTSLGKGVIGGGAGGEEGSAAAEACQ